MGYWIGTSGSLVLPEADEPRAVAHARRRMLEVEDSGWLSEDEPVTTLDDLARFVGATCERRGNVLVVDVDDEGDPKWSDQATAFWTALGDVVTSGRIDVLGEDGCRWSYDYTPDGVVQHGRNGWDGTGEPHEDEAEDGEAEPETPEQRRQRGRRYLVLGAIPAAYGAVALGVGSGSGALPLGVGVLNLLIAWRLLRVPP